MSLPLPWVDKIFQKLTLTFGRDFLGRWEGIPIEELKADWAHELRNLQQSPASIAYGLETCLAGKPPTVQEFRAACVRHVPPTVALPSPPADPERVAAELAKLRKPEFNADGKAWAHALKRRHEAGERLNLNQIRCYQTALRINQAGANP